MTVTTKEIHLKARPSGTPDESHFELKEIELPKLADGEIRVQNSWMTVDPYMRGRMREGKSYIEPFEVGEALSGEAIGTVVESRAKNLSEGTTVSSMFGWREQYVADADTVRSIPAEVPAQHYLGVLGMPGLTAYAGIRRIAQPKKNETIFVSAASGAVGSIVCQLARLNGCKVIGSSGSNEKLEWLKKSAGVDEVINYKECDSLSEALAAAAPNGIDIYWDNVGAEHLEAAIANLNNRGRIVACGMIAGYNSEEPPAAPRNLMQIVAKRLTIQGLLVFDHQDLQGEFLSEMTPLVKEEKIAFKETVVEGLENAPSAFLGLFEGENLGKMLVKLMA